MATPQTAVTLAAAVFAAGIGVVNPSGSKGSRASHDIHSYSDAQLHRDLFAELSEMYKHGSPTQNLTACQLAEEAMEALGDDGDADDNDPFDDEIDLSDLEQAMADIGKDLEEEVEAAVGCHPGSETGLQDLTVHGAAGAETAGIMPPRRTGAGQVEARVFRDIRAKGR